VLKLQIPYSNVNSSFDLINCTDINEGSSTGAVNFPEVSLRSLTIDEENHARVCVVHHNMAGALREFNNIFSEVDINVNKQFSDSRSVLFCILLIGRGDVAYMIADISEVREDQIKDIYKKLSATPFNIVTRMLY
jgi:D-3-phosphoglycerate dehydrogenase / 2-oxoglutarate reductase